MIDHDEGKIHLRQTMLAIRPIDNPSIQPERLELGEADGEHAAQVGRINRSEEASALMGEDE